MRRDVRHDMTDQEAATVRAAFDIALRDEPPLPSVTDAAVTGGRRLRRRRTALTTAAAGAGALALAGLALLGIGTSTGAVPDPVPSPVLPATQPPVEDHDFAPPLEPVPDPDPEPETDPARENVPPGTDPYDRQTDEEADRIRRYG
ncbi:hypothetical protein [Streptomyces carpaticus]|uniref:hypothetical protein n=1 Tax=Streptomyces carpaticus TaxID=285558 RepID=UPI0031F7279E